MEISILGLIGIGLGTMFFGYFFGLFEGRGQGYRRRRKEEEQERSVKDAFSPAPPNPKQNLLELGQDPTGSPKLLVDGRAVNAADVAPNQRKRLIELMVMMRPWIEPSPSAPPSSAATAAGPVQAPAPPVATTAGPTEPTVAPTPASLSLVEQIDSILQARIAGTPLAARGIRLAQSLHGGALVFIGTTQYDGVDKVPDPEVQAAIRAAIAEWEKTYTPR